MVDGWLFLKLGVMPMAVCNTRRRAAVNKRLGPKRGRVGLGKGKVASLRETITRISKTARKSGAK